MGQILRVAKLSDRQVLRLVDDFQGSGDGDMLHCEVAIAGINRSYPADEFEALRKGSDIGAITAFDMIVGKPGLTIRFRRGIGGNPNNIDSPERQASPYLDEISIVGRNSNGQNVSPSRLIAAQRLIHKHVQLPADPTVTGAANEAVDLLKLQFSQLSEQLLEINTHSLKRREELEDEYNQKRRELDEELARHAEQVREKTKKLEFEHKLGLESLEAREKQLDDRDHIHARRELRTHITDAIADQLKGDLVPRKASTMRWSVLGLLLFGALGLGGISAWSLYEFGELTYLASLKETFSEQSQRRAFALSQIESGFHWLVLVRGFISGAASIGFLLYAVSWLKGLYHDEIRTRRELQRYATDLNRASWAIEMIMETKPSGGIEIPDSVIIGVTRNLFEASGVAKSNKETSANALAELLRTSGKARFGPNGAEFELSSRGANKLADKIDQ